MIAGLALGSDSKRYFRGMLPRLAIVTIIFMPLLYGALYLWGFWDPFGKVDQIPAAIVNQDKGAVAQGQKIKAGKQLTATLIESGQLDLTEVSYEDAKSGLADGDYYFTIVIPSNFSKAIASPAGNNPRKAKLTFTYNDANNYLAQVIGQDAAGQVINKAESGVGAKTMNQVLKQIQAAGAKLKTAADGASELASKLGEASAGSAKLSGGTNTLAGQAAAAIASINRLTDSASNLTNQINGINDPVLNTLNIGEYQQIADEAGQLIQQLNNLAAQLSSAAANPVPGGVTPEEANAANAVVSEISAGAAQIESKLRIQNDTLSGAIAQVEQELNAKVAEVQSGVTQLNNGANELSSGMVKLSAGADELASGLEEGLKQVPQWTKKQRLKVADTLSTPLLLVQKTDNAAPTFGSGFAPFFFSLALFVGGMLIWMILTPIQSRATVSGLNSYRTVITSYLSGIIVGAIQVLALFFVVYLALGLKVNNVIGMILFMMLASGSFIAMIQAFNAVFDIAIGRVVTLAVLMVQLVSAGGVYPVPVTSLPFQWIHPFDPMTYTVNGMRQLTVATSVDSRLWVAIAVLVGILVVSLSVSAFAVRRNRQYNMTRLYPPIEV
ncbi:MAG: YhgE/Pip domain-containing protein [Solirubrobacterales bacterium]